MMTSLILLLWVLSLFMVSSSCTYIYSTWHIPLTRVFNRMDDFMLVHVSTGSTNIINLKEFLSEVRAVVLRHCGEVSHFTIWLLVQRRILMQVFLVPLGMLGQAELYYCLKEKCCLTSVFTLVGALKVIICVLATTGNCKSVYWCRRSWEDLCSYILDLARNISCHKLVRGLSSDILQPGRVQVMTWFLRDAWNQLSHQTALWRLH